MITPVVVEHVRRWEKHAQARARLGPVHMRADLRHLREWVQRRIEDRYNVLREYGARWDAHLTTLCQGQLQALLDVRRDLDQILDAWSEGYAYSRAAERLLKKGRV